jgi:hypothetical protein
MLEWERKGEISTKKSLSKVIQLENKNPHTRESKAKRNKTKQKKEKKIILFIDVIE